MMDYMYLTPRIRPLYKFIGEMRDAVTTCPSCGDVVDRLTTIFDGRIVPRATLLTMKAKISEDDWLDQRDQWKYLCRHCAQVETIPAEPFDLVGFHRWLKGSAIMASSQHEYVVRIRRLVDNYDRQQLADALAGDSLVETILAMVPERDARNYRRALVKYQQFSQSK